VVRFCQNYLVGPKTKHVQFKHVHKMEDRFGKDAPIAARFRVVAPPSPQTTDQSEEPTYNPVPYVPQHRRRLPELKKLRKRNVRQSNTHTSNLNMTM
jgi:hypothetical protein